MRHFFVGDLQGCFKELQALLHTVKFEPQRDKLWLTGDLVARGPDSLACLEFVKDLDDSAQTVLGNHDLHLLAIAYGIKSPKTSDKLAPLISSPRFPEFIDWLRQQPVLSKVDKDCYLVHAGISPQWSVKKAKSLAKKIQITLNSDANTKKLLEHMYGDEPSYWSDSLSEADQLRYAINVFTRMRYCYADGRLDMSSKQPIGKQPKGLVPWFEICPLLDKVDIIFGHWASLEGKTSKSSAIALDTGCVWGKGMTMLQWPEKTRIFQSTLDKLA